ncbi:conjugative transposon protein TraK [Tenacibaculum finnmarkense]|uniref:conjugative transposon protein TraK n=2 Tax=Tenacibaculum finnmarkense TaxID=2781243 RepID=UPI00187B11E9|nr:conjugative transposon protein TraK [Tenacibaculum finnmarkense]MBE7634992.1 conjugative transposon protein TraK [Tenacibaculum finnmarkense genomovar ulcerans]MBE7649040.1 conjugative transposon protein TraK [Tenacibaculum finnmarkense genomovar ulcerans]MCD8401293.1 conjugative transposon protein TraK [Tenacibaculum finnmarkense genomovar ulcerans]MCD8403819.1 conjugative transposon protein TraK [Tenacibaculum finnmarkense genomovar finnmarkense]MCD8430905.1 conjugative transposon protein
MDNLKNIDSAFRYTRLISIIVVIICLGGMIYMHYDTMQIIQNERKKIYVLDKGDALTFALSQNSHQNKKVEIVNHIKMFHKFFFDLDPDPSAIKKQINNALYLVDGSGKKYNDVREEKLFYHDLVDGSMSLRIYIDSINVDLNQKPYTVRFFGKQKVIRRTKVIFKELWTICTIRDNLKRTNFNPHGLMMERFKIINNKVIDERIRN